MGTTQLVQVLVVLPLLAFWAYCLYDFARTPDHAIRGYDRQTWVLLLVFTSLFGCALWILRGRPTAPRRR